MTSAVRTVTLPVPPSGNRYWRRAGTNIYISEEGVAYRAAVAKLLRGSRVLAGDVAVHAVWYRARRAGDVDNRGKVLLDALQGVLYTDDKQVADWRITRTDADPKNPRMEVAIWPM